METRLGIYVASRGTVPFADRMAMIRDAGFVSTCLWWEEENSEARRLRHFAPYVVRRCGLHVDNIHVPYRRCEDLWSLDRTVRAAIVEQHLSWIDDCRRHEIPMLVMHVVLGTRTPPNGQGIDSMQRIVAAAEDAGVTVAIENTRSPGHVEALLEAIPSPLLGLCFDTSHDLLYGDPPVQLLKDWGHRLAATHLSDTDGKRDYHWLPGEGIIDFETIAAHLPESYGGCYMLEVAPTPREAPLSEFLSDAYESALSMSRLFRKREGHPVAAVHPTN